MVVGRLAANYKLSRTTHEPVAFGLVVNTEQNTNVSMHIVNYNNTQKLKYLYKY
jgi:hypothetical protein